MLLTLLISIIIHPTLATINHQCSQYYCINNLLDKLAQLAIRHTGVEKKSTAAPDKQNGELLMILKTINQTMEGLTEFMKRQQEINTQFKEENKQVKRTLESQTMSMMALVDAATGSSYVRWGSKSCPGNGTDLLYSGYVGGSYHAHRGAATNPLCLPKDPLWDHFRTDWESGAKLYGGEYEFHVNDPEYVSKSAEFFGKSLNDKFATCSVCASSRPHIVMIPGRTACYDGWTKEYSGYLSAGHHNQISASQYVCLDKSPEFHTDGKISSNGVMFFFVDAVCGTLPCPPYVEGREITCVVCTM